MVSGALLHKIRLVNVGLLTLAISLAAVENVAPAPVYAGPERHWPTTHRDITMVDRTGDKGWHQAIGYAAAAWSEGKSGADVRITHTTGTGPCTFVPQQISVCLATYEQLERREGRAAEKVGKGDHSDAVIVLVCSDCGLDRRRRAVVATHEVGHALGLDHVARITSVMCSQGCSEVPDALDYAALRAKDDHVDPSQPSAGCRFFRKLRLRC